MKLVVISHARCWSEPTSPNVYVTGGGFPFQMRALSELFDATTLVLPLSLAKASPGTRPLEGLNMSIIPLTFPPRTGGFSRRLKFITWTAQNVSVILRQIRAADAVHTPIPGDIGTVGMLLAFMLRKPLFVRHCGNWFTPRTQPEHFWKWFMGKFAGGRNVMLATGGGTDPPSQRNPNIHWIFATSLTERQLQSYAHPRSRLPGDAPRLIIACRQEIDKGTHIVIKSLPIILQTFPKASLDVVGDGGALLMLKDLARVAGVQGQVTFHGKVVHEKVLQLLQQADLMCYPTTASEGFPKIVLEALACGLPIVTTRVSVLPILLKSGCGLLLQDVTPQALARAIQECLSDEQAYRAMSMRAIETASQYPLERWRDTIGALLEGAWGTL